MEESLKIKVGAEVRDAQKQLDKLNKTLEDTGSAAKGIGNSTKAANTSLTNFGRIAQDAAFGPIAIANNIDPLIQSFITLRRESGSAGGALRALGSSLLGGGGLILGFSLLTFALSGGLDSLKQYVPGLKEAAKAQKEAAEEAKKWADAQKDSAVQVQKQRFEVEQLVKVARGDIGTKQEQIAALSQLNKQIPDYIGVLTQQNIKTKEGAAIITAYTNALLKQATAELLRGRAAELSVKRFDDERKLRQQLQDNLSKQAGLERQINSLLDKRSNSIGSSFETTTAQIQGLRNESNRLKNEFPQLIESFKQTRTGLNKEIADLQAEVDKNTVVISTETDASPEKIQKEIIEKLRGVDITIPLRTTFLDAEGISVIQKEIRPLVDRLGLGQLNTQLALPGAKEGANNVEELAKRLRGAFGVDRQATRQDQLRAQIEQLELQLQAIRLLGNGDIPTDLIQVSKEIKEAIGDLNGELVASNELIVAFGSVFQDAFSSALISGKNFFQSFINGLKQLVARLIAAAAAAAVLSAILSAIGGRGFASTFSKLFGVFSGFNIGGSGGGIALPSGPAINGISFPRGNDINIVVTGSIQGQQINITGQRALRLNSING